MQQTYLRNKAAKIKKWRSGDKGPTFIVYTYSIV